ncbi:MAG: CRISPR-associated endonuclease Cas1, partial [Aquificota bacterium]
MGNLHNLKRPLLFFSNGYNLSKKKGRLCVKLNGKEHTFPVSYLSALFLVGRGTITTEALTMLSRAGTGLCLLSRNFNLKGIFTPEDEHSSVVERRIRQYELWKSQRLRVASRIVVMKIIEVEREFSVNLEYMRTMAERADSIEELMGYEGIASRYMFESLSREIPQFSGRNYRPPKDHVNALLSLVYNIAYYQARSLLLTLGLDPYLSFLHSRRGRHASFASDIMEPLRPFLTKHVVELLKKDTITTSHFIKDKESRLLNRDGMRIFINSLEPVYQKCLDRLWDTLLELME